MRKRLVAGNWKMHGSLAGNRALLAALKAADLANNGVGVAVCVPFPFLQQVQQELSGSGIDWGAQNVSEHAAGAFTGEVSAAMLGEFGCRYALVGHSERRALYGESDAQVAAKFSAACAAGLAPILCLGETLAEREAGITQKVVARQLAAVLGQVGVEGLVGSVIAYEPVWAIGTGRTASPDQAQEVHGYIRGLVAARDARVADGICILYGGSVKPGNARELFTRSDVDGGLIGGASLVAEDFVAICRAAAD
jgi:triosephosphate isomerase